MKKNLLYLILAMCFVGTIVSCDKDEDGESGTSVLTLNGEEFNPNSACELWHYGSDNYFDMHLWDGTLEQNYGKVEGSGDWLNLELYTDSYIPTGTFTVSDSGDLGSCSAYVREGASVDYSGNISADNNYSYNTGTVKIESSDASNTYKVTLDLSDGNGNICTGKTTITFRYMNVN